MTSFGSGPYSFLTHFMDITAYHGVLGTPNQVKYAVKNCGSNTYQTETIQWTCANSNMTSFRAHTKGIMAKGGIECSTPTVPAPQMSCDSAWRPM